MDCFLELQSAYRQHHSTETVLLEVKNDLLMAMDKGQVTLLVLLDLTRHSTQWNMRSLKIV